MSAFGWSGGMSRLKVVQRRKHQLVPEDTKDFFQQFNLKNV